jgi:hypothetical protein
MGHRRLPSPNSLRAELKNENLPPGSHEPSVVQFGCERCPNGHCFVTGWLSVTKLVEMMDGEPNVPRGFVAENFSLIGKANACPIDECQHEDTLKTVVMRSQPFPDISD